MSESADRTLNSTVTAVPASSTSHAVALACETYYRKRLRADLGNWSWLVDSLVESPKAQTTHFGTRHKKTGGLAILLRGGAFRGLGSIELKRAAQIECSRSVHRMLIRPLVDIGIRVSVFLTLYKSDVLKQELLDELQQPYSAHVAAITTLEAKPEQLTSTIYSLKTLQAYCESAGTAYDAVLMTRYDMRFKMSVLDLLQVSTSASGGDGAPAEAAHPFVAVRDGIRFLWHEKGGTWRLVWTAPPEMLARGTAAEKHGWASLTSKMVSSRSSTFQRGWKLQHRTADTLHAFDFRFLECFHRSVRFETTRSWSSERELRKLRTGRRTANLSATETEARLRDIYPENHWMHKMKDHLLLALRVPRNTVEWAEHGTALPTLGYLLPDGAFSSNPCGSTCMLNPVYDFLPRGDWVVKSGICQRPSDFVYDEKSRSLCCPSPDYCCPNSADNCSAPSAQLFSMATANGGRPVPYEQLRTGWRQHFQSQERHQDNSTLCYADRNEWNGGSQTPACMWTMDAASIDTLRDAWSSLPRLPRWHDDDDTHSWGKTAHR